MKDLLRIELENASSIHFHLLHPSRPKPKKEEKQKSKTTLMHPHRAQFIILCPGHKSLTEPLIDHENDLSGDLRAQKPSFLRSGILPLGEILGHFDALDAGGCLPVAVAVAGGGGGGVVGAGWLLREHHGGGGVGGGLLRLVVLLELLRVPWWS